MPLRPAFSLQQPPGAIEGPRALAVVLLVMYHVIGAAPDGGLHLSGMHPGRLSVDFLADLRMPLFAFISGHVYALKPVDPARLWMFLRGKLRRLAVPGIVAISVFMVFSSLMNTRFAPDHAWWLNYVTPYAHYWFVQAILLIFFLFGSFDILSRGRYLPVIFVASLLLYLVGWWIPTAFMSVNQAVYLLPYFLFGVLIARHPGTVVKHRAPIILLAAAVLLAATWVNLDILQETGRFSRDRRDLQSLGFGMAATTLCYLLLPEIRTRALGAFSFTIYLYHVLATSGMRRALLDLGIHDVALHVLLGTVAGIALPILLHVAAQQHPLSRRLILGEAARPLRHKITF